MSAAKEEPSPDETYSLKTREIKSLIHKIQLNHPDDDDVADLYNLVEDFDKFMNGKAKFSNSAFSKEEPPPDYKQGDNVVDDFDNLSITNTRVCTACKQEKPMDEFLTHKNGNTYKICFLCSGKRWAKEMAKVHPQH
tara:strand:- start:352 stop:762 length:411 start_codon:yes stop_codon:yes gene_type:complete